MVLRQTKKTKNKNVTGRGGTGVGDPFRGYVHLGPLKGTPRTVTISQCMVNKTKQHSSDINHEPHQCCRSLDLTRATSLIVNGR